MKKTKYNHVKPQSPVRSSLRLPELFGAKALAAGAQQPQGAPLRKNGWKTEEFWVFLVGFCMFLWMFWLFLGGFRKGLWVWLFSVCFEKEQMLECLCCFLFGWLVIIEVVLFDACLVSKWVFWLCFSELHGVSLLCYIAFWALPKQEVCVWRGDGCGVTAAVVWGATRWFCDFLVLLGWSSTFERHSSFAVGW